MNLLNILKSMRIPTKNIENFKNLKLLLMFDGLDEILNIQSLFDDLKIENVSSKVKCIFSIRRYEIEDSLLKKIFIGRFVETIYICPF